MATLTWNEGETIRAADLSAATATTVGRRADATLVVQNETVSRIHFVLRPGATGFSVENLSQSTQTKVGGAPISGARALADGELIQAGTAEFGFHDLARAPGRQEVQCSHCSRPNGVARRECWFCGTSMVNALTTGFKIARPLARLVGASSAVTLFDGECAIRGDGDALEAINAAPETEPIIQQRGSDWVIGPGAAREAVRVSGRGAAPGEKLSHRDALELAGIQYVFLAKG